MSERAQHNERDISPLQFGPTAVFQDYRDLFDLHQSFIALADKLVCYFSSTDAPRPPRDHQLAQQAILAISLNTYAAIPYLCNDGFGNHALLLVRKLFELVVAVRFLRMDEDLYPYLYNHNLHIHEIYELHEMETLNPPNVQPRPDNYQELLNCAREELKKLKSRIAGLRDFRDLRKYVDVSWSGHDMRSMCRMIDANVNAARVSGLEIVYLRRYKPLSNFIHSSGTGRWSCVRLTETGWRLDPRPSDRYVPSAFSIAAHFFCYILQDIIESNHYSMPDELRLNLKNLYKRNGELSRKYNLETK